MLSDATLLKIIFDPDGPFLVGVILSSHEIKRALDRAEVEQYIENHVDLSVFDATQTASLSPVRSNTL